MMAAFHTAIVAGTSLMAGAPPESRPRHPRVRSSHTPTTRSPRPEQTGLRTAPKSVWTAARSSPTNRCGPLAARRGDQTTQPRQGHPARSGRRSAGTRPSSRDTAETGPPSHPANAGAGAPPSGPLMLNLVHEPRPSLCGGSTPQAVATSRVPGWPPLRRLARPRPARPSPMRDARCGRDVFGLPSWGSATVGHAMRWF